MSNGKRFERQPPGRDKKPIRNAGGFYRTAESKGREHGGVTINTPNDALVAAVRLAYKVAESQVERSTRIARRLRDAGDKAVGKGSDKKAMDAAERLVMNTMMSALEWWETSVAQGRCPVKRLAAAEYRMMGSILGLDASSAKPKSGASKSARSKDRDDESAAPRPPRESRDKLRIVHKGVKRAVQVVDWDMDRVVVMNEPMEFFQGDTQAKFAARLQVKDGSAALVLTLDAKPSGVWRAAICLSDGEQIGFIELEI